MIGNPPSVVQPHTEPGSVNLRNCRTRLLLLDEMFQQHSVSDLLCTRTLHGRVGAPGLLPPGTIPECGVERASFVAGEEGLWGFLPRYRTGDSRFRKTSGLRVIIQERTSNDRDGEKRRGSLCRIDKVVFRVSGDDLRSPRT